MFKKKKRKNLKTHQTFIGWPVNFIADADAGLAGLQGVRKAANLQDQEVHGV